VAAILLAEDDNAVRAFVTRALEHDGHEVTAVEDGSLALEALSKRGFDMLLSDIVMPELDGVALALKVAKDYPGLPVLLMTGYAERQRAHNLEVFIHEVVAKPFTLPDIRAAVSRTLAGAAS
jgi:CheY-like chemotaxis protein